MNKTYAMLLAALAAADLVTGGCEQRAPAGGQKIDHANALTGKVEQPSGAIGQSRTDQAANADQSASKLAGADDTMITTKVKAALLAEPGLKSQQIDVATKDATVTLSGSVESDIARDRAKQIALSTEGVKNVVDNMSPKATS
jgi:hyperosmotically inducible protein